MRLKSLRLRNYRQHSSRDVNLDGNIVAVVGRNGTGKSNLLGAINFALTGELPGQTRKSVPTWGRAGPSLAELDFEHKGALYTVRRRADANEVLLHKNGAKLTSGARDVAAAMRSEVGLDADLCKQAVFVRQKEVDSVLFADPAEREQAWQRLVGIKDAPKVYAELGQIVSSSRPPLVDKTGAVATLSAARARLRMRKASAAEAQERVAHTARPPDTSALAEALTKRDAVDKMLAGAVDALAALPEVGEDIPAEPPDVEKAKAEMSKAQRREAAKERVREAADKVSRAMEMEKGLGPDISADRDAVAAECARLEAERAHLAKLHNASVKSGHGVCELCGGRLEDAAARAAQLAAELAAVMGASAQARSELAKMDAAVSKRRAAAAEVATLMSVGTEIGTDAMKSLDDLGEGPCVKDAEALLLAARLARSRWDAARSAIERRAQQNGMVARLASERAAADAAYQTAAEPFGGISPMDAPALIAAASKAAADAQCAQAQLEHCRRELILAKADATAAAKAALACRAKARDALSACRRVDQLAKVREWFHYANGPRFVSSRAMAMVSGGVNNFLESMGSAFSVIPDEAKLEFSAVFSDGRSDVPVSAQELSGGEKVALAVCFRLSAYCAFAGRLGVLSLDEPTVYLDDDNVSGFCRLMENLRVVAGKMSTQVLLATHEKSVAETADLIVQL